MSWFTEGAEAAEATAASMGGKRRKNFFTTAGERAVIRFLAPATQSFNYKRSFVKSAPGEKMLTSYDSPDCPLVISPTYNLQAAFGWWVLDRRILKFKDKQTGEEKEVGPRVLYFADGQRTRKQLIAFEKDMLISHNEELEEDGKPPVEIEDFNLTGYDITASKEAKAPWNFTAKRAKPLSEADLELIEKSLGVTYEELVAGKSTELLAEELAPLPKEQLAAIVGTAGGGAGVSSPAESDDPSVAYSYTDDDEDVIKFDD